jgi:hypothetical protein
MTPDDALAFIEQLLTDIGKRLNDTQREVFRGSWAGKSYKEIYKACAGCSPDHITQNVGPELWKLIGTVLGEPVSKKTLKGPIERAYAGQKQLAAERGAAPIAETPVSSSDWTGSQSGSEPSFETSSTQDFWAVQSQPQENWGAAPDTAAICGRTRELEQLDHWIRVDGCRLVVVFGVSGVGKTLLCGRLAEQLRDQFEFLLWRSLDQPVPLPEFIRETTEFLSQGTSTSEEVTDLLHWLMHYRCLLVLDGWETLLQPGVHDGSYRSSYEEYSDLLRQIGRTARQSCLIITSREKPREIVLLESEQQRVRSFELNGLGDVGSDFFNAKEIFLSDGDWRRLRRYCAANPLLLNLVAIYIRDLFGGDVAAFLQDYQPENTLLPDVEHLLTQQFERLSKLEKTIMQSLVNEPVTLAEIFQLLAAPISRMEVQEALQSLRRRSLIEVTAGRYALHRLMLDYLRLRTAN